MSEAAEIIHALNGTIRELTVLYVAECDEESRRFAYTIQSEETEERAKRQADAIMGQINAAYVRIMAIATIPVREHDPR